MSEPDGAIEWLLEGDAAIRWQVMRDLLDAPETEWRAERARVETTGWGARLLAAEDTDGQWDGGAFLPGGFTAEEWEQVGQPWTATCWTLTQLREFGLDPACAAAQRAVALIGENARWDHDGQRFFDGEVEECINGRLVTDATYFGVDVSPVVDRLLGDRLGDGGWNCERENGAEVSSFASTISVLEGLLQVERAGRGTEAIREARRSGEAYLLARGLFRRLSTGAPADEQFLTLTYPRRWYYDILRALEYFRDAGRWDQSAPDPALADALRLLASKRGADGRWRLEWRPAGRVWFELEGDPGSASRWLTLGALRVLRWADRELTLSPPVRA